MDDEIKALREENARLKNDLAGVDRDGGQRQDEIARLRAHVAALVTALEMYGEHTVECEREQAGSCCVCGLAAALDAVEVK